MPKRVTIRKCGAALVILAALALIVGTAICQAEERPRLEPKITQADGELRLAPRAAPRQDDEPRLAPRSKAPTSDSSQGGLTEPCLEKQNGEMHLKQGDVYENGRLKFRIMGWSRENSEYLIGLRSTAPGFNRYIRNRSLDFSVVDTSLCPGKELLLRCTYYKDYLDIESPTFKCGVSEF